MFAAIRHVRSNIKPSEAQNEGGANPFAVGAGSPIDGRRSHRGMALIPVAVGAGRKNEHEGKNKLAHMKE